MRGGNAGRESLGEPLHCARYTDGLVFMAMAWEPPEVVRCHACRGFYWLRDAVEIGRMRDTPWSATGSPSGSTRSPSCWQGLARTSGI